MNVKDFGAVGGRITDDTQAIQDAINHCLNNPNPIRTLYLPGGTYKITDISVKYIPRFHEETKGDVANGSTIILNVSKPEAWRKGDRIFGGSIPEGAYIISKNQSSFEISTPALTTATGVRLYDADVYKFSGSPM